VADRDGDGEAGPLVATLSRSGTVVDALVGAEAAVLIGESRPAREGVGVAERLADAGLDVTLTTDAALPALVARAGRDGRPAGESSEAAGEVPTREVPVPEEATVDERDATRQVDVVLVGADAVLADGSVVNKTGTFATALAAARAGVPVYVVAARDKVRPDERRTTEASPPESVYDGPAAIRVDAPTFDWTPAEVVDGVVTEDGLVATDDVAAVAAEHRRTAAWDE
jgi:translation initiation factor 2B subunit (eIF-2B alpha/beta/delta family)